MPPASLHQPVHPPAAGQASRRRFWQPARQAGPKAAPGRGPGDKSEKTRGQGEEILAQVKLLAALGLLMVVITVGLVGLTLSRLRAERRAATEEQETLDRSGLELRRLTVVSRGLLQGILDVRAAPQPPDPLNTGRAPPAEVAEQVIVRLSAAIRELSQGEKDTGPLINRLAAAAREVTAWRAAYDALWRDAGSHRTLSATRAALDRLRGAAAAQDGAGRPGPALAGRRGAHETDAAAAGTAGPHHRKLRDAPDSIDPRGAAHFASTDRGAAHFASTDRGAAHFASDLRNELGECALLVERLNGEEDIDRLEDIKDHHLQPVLTDLGRLVAAVMQLKSPRGGAARRPQGRTAPAAGDRLDPAAVSELATDILGSGADAPPPRRPARIARWATEGPRGDPAIFPGGLFRLRHELLRLRGEREVLLDLVTTVFLDIEQRNAQVARRVQVRSQSLTSRTERSLTTAWLDLLAFAALCVASFGALARLIQRGINGQVGAIEARQRDMRLVLDNVNQGLLTLDLDGTMVGERSAVLDQWLGPPPGGGGPIPFAALLSAIDPALGTAFALGWESILDDFLPVEMSLGQLPRRLCQDGRVLQLGYRPIYLGDRQGDRQGRPDKVLVVISDITAQVNQERIEAEQRDLLGAIAKMLENKDAFSEFFDDASRMVSQLSSDPAARHKRGRPAPPTPTLTIEEQKRLLHTLKGNGGIFRLGHFVSVVHGIETRLEQSPSGLTVADRVLLATTWSELSLKLGALLGHRGERLIELSRSEYDDLLERLRAGASAGELLRLCGAWQLPRLRGKLEVFADHARELAMRLHKCPVNVQVEDGDLRLDLSRFAGFFAAFIHVVRNAVDHGLEEPHERTLSGKGERAAIYLRAYRAYHFDRLDRLDRVDGANRGDRSFRAPGAAPFQDSLVIEISDDGRGIDWERVAERARRMGLPADSAHERTQALFADGLSTCEQVSESSGRGVGLGAVHAACAQLGGFVQIDSQQGQGTTMRFRFPSHLLTVAPPLPTANTVVRTLIDYDERQERPGT